MIDPASRTGFLALDDSQAGNGPVDHTSLLVHAEVQIPVLDRHDDSVGGLVRGLGKPSQ